jgi:putative DNA primase/helicase
MAKPPVRPNGRSDRFCASFSCTRNRGNRGCAMSATFTEATLAELQAELSVLIHTSLPEFQATDEWCAIKRDRDNRIADLQERIQQLQPPAPPKQPAQTASAPPKASIPSEFAGSFTPGKNEEYEINNTEVGNARRLLQTYAKVLRWHVEDQMWLVWDRNRWIFDEKAHEPIKKMKEVLQQVQTNATLKIEELGQEAYEIHEKHKSAALKKGKAYDPEKEAFSSQEQKVFSALKNLEADRKWAQKSESDRAVRGAVHQAESDPYCNIRVEGELLDQKLMLFNVLNGTYDLETNTFGAHDMQHLLTKIAPIVYNPTAKCPGFEKFVSEIFNGDAELVEFMQRSFGYTLSGLVNIRILSFLMGEGGNGKSALSNIMLGIFGSGPDGYGLEPNFTTFCTGRFVNPDSPRNDIMRFKGKRLITAAENDNRSAELDTATLKRMSGDDAISGRANFSAEETFKPQAKIFLRMNNEIRISDKTDSIWDRIKRVPFEMKFDENDPKCDRNLTKRLLSTESSGILNWLIDGWKKVQSDLAAGKNPIPTPQKIVAETREYRESQSQVQRFFEATYELRPGGAESCAMAFQRFKQWCALEGDRPDSNQTTFGRDLGRLLKKHGVEKKPYGDRRQLHFIGIAVIGTDEVAF